MIKVIDQTKLDCKREATEEGMLDRWQVEGMEARKQCISSGQQGAGAGADGGERGGRR